MSHEKSQHPRTGSTGQQFNPQIVADLLDRASAFAIAAVRNDDAVWYARVITYVDEIPSTDTEVESVISWLVAELQAVALLDDDQRLQRVCAIRTELCNDLSWRGWFGGGV